MIIELNEGKLQIRFRVNEDKSVELVNFTVLSGTEDLPLQVATDAGGFDVPFKPKQFLAAHVTGESSGGFHAGKHDAGSLSPQWRYRDHRIETLEHGKRLTLFVEAQNGLAADYVLETFEDLPIVRSWATLINRSDTDIGIEYCSSFFYQGIGKNRTSSNYDALQIYVPHNGWANEAQWQNVTASNLGLSHMPLEGYSLPDKGNSRFYYGSTDSWSTSEHLPMGIVRDPESNEVFFCQIEHSGAWEIEYGMGDGKNLYVCLLGPSNDSAWWKNLKPGQSFTTVPAAFGTDIGGIDEAIACLTEYRRRIRRPNPDDEHCYVVFNDYMNCLFGDPTEEKEKKIIDLAAALGCEYYCLDCGWYDSGPWWDKVGEWKESPERFPNGLKSLYEYARSKGLRMGMWLEIEVMGTQCELPKHLPDDWFICTHGKRRIENKRYLLDFRNPAVRQYCTDTVDRLIETYGCEFFKIDYNCTTGPGSDLNTDSMGDAMLEHYRALYDWIRSVYEKHPGLVIENCGSGAQRMDYGMLSLHSLQSTSDQTDVLSNAYIAVNVASAVTPEQAGMWVYPYEDDREHVIFNMVNGLLLRPYISGNVWKMTPANFELFREGIALYKKIRGDLTGMVPFFPLGFGKVNNAQLAYGVHNQEKAYLAVFAVHTDTVEVPLAALKGKAAECKVIYPESRDCEMMITDGNLVVNMPQTKCARLIEIRYEL